MDVYNAFSSLVSPEVPPYLMSSVNEADAKRAYTAFLDFKNVVKQNPITAKAAMPTALAGDTSQFKEAAQKLSSASYPFLKEISWNSDLYLTPLPDVSAYSALKAIDKALVLSTFMDEKLLQEAAEAHCKAIGNVNSDLVTTEADYAAINEAIGKLIASTPKSQVMAVYDAFRSITNPAIPAKLLSTVNMNDAFNSYAAFLKFKDVVAGSQGSL